MHQTKTEEAILAVDIGNTNVTCGIYRQGKLIWFARFFSSRKRTADEYYGLLNSLLTELPPSQIRRVALASVVPELTRIWQHLFAKYTSAQVLEIGARSDLGLSFRVKDPSFIGADLVMNAYGAWQKYQSDCIILDLGTATKVQFVTATGRFEGTAIAPGLKTSADHLFEKAALLSQIELVQPSGLLGTNTVDALLSGIVQGHAFMLENYVQEIKRQYPNRKGIQTILTGGVAELVKPLIPSADVLDKTLTLDGLQLAYRRLADL